MIHEIAALNPNACLAGRSQEIAVFLQSRPVVIEATIPFGLNNLDEADARARTAPVAVWTILDVAAEHVAGCPVVHCPAHARNQGAVA